MWNVQRSLLLKIRYKLSTRIIDMARGMGVSRATYGRYELGEVMVPAHRWKRLSKIISKEEALRSYIEDIVVKWEREYDE